MRVWMCLSLITFYFKLLSAIRFFLPSSRWPKGGYSCLIVIELASLQYFTDNYFRTLITGHLIRGGHFTGGCLTEVRLYLLSCYLVPHAHYFQGLLVVHSTLNINSSMSATIHNDMQLKNTLGLFSRLCNSRSRPLGTSFNFTYLLLYWYQEKVFFYQIKFPGLKVFSFSYKATIHYPKG